MSADRGHVYWNGTFSDSEKQRLIPDALPAALNRCSGATCARSLAERQRQRPERLLWFDQKYYLADDILVKSDRISMAHSLEVRPPFLDHRIVEFANRIPASLKISGSRQKLVLQQLMKDKLPHSVLHRPKVGFDIPAHDWLRGPLRSLLIETLRAGAAEYPDIFRPDVIEAHLQDHLERRVNIGYHLWGLMILLLWMKKWNIQAAAARHSHPVGVRSRSWSVYLALLLIAGSVYLTGIISPPSLQDDVDAVQAQIARNMLTTGDWVTARLDGVAYLEKPPLIYWMMAGSYKIFGVHDWAARLPDRAVLRGALPADRGFRRSGPSAERPASMPGLCMATCVGLYLFTRVLIPDVILTFTITLAMWALLRVTDEAETHPRAWAFRSGSKPGNRAAAEEPDRRGVPDRRPGVIYLFLTKQLFQARTWKRLHPFSGLLVILLIAVPWHVLATLRNPPYFSLSMHSGPRRVSRLPVVLLHQRATAALPEPALSARLQHGSASLVLALPPGVAVSVERVPPGDRQAVVPAGGSRRTHAPAGAVLDRLRAGVLHLLHHAGVLFDAVLSGAGAAAGLGDGDGRRLDPARYSDADRSRLPAAAAAAIAILVLVRNVPTPGDIFNALTSHPSAYTLSLGHMEDLTLQSFAYLRMPLLLAAIAFVIGAVGTFRAGAEACLRVHYADDVAVLPGRAAGAGHLRSRPVVAAAGGGDPALARGQADRRPATTTRFRRCSSTPIARRCC